MFSSSPVFEVVVSDPVCIDQQLFKMWLQGYSAAEASVQKKTDILNTQDSELKASSQRQLFRLFACIQSECEDEFRVYEMMEKYLIDSQLLRHDTFVIQLSADLHRLMTERYYEFDEPLMRLLLGKKLSSKDRKELDEISDSTAIRLSSCQRQFDNLKRIREAILEVADNEQQIQWLRNHGYADLIRRRFGLSKSLALYGKYARVVFLSQYRFDTMKKLTDCPLIDFEYFAAVIMKHWSYESTLDATTEPHRASTTLKQIHSSAPSQHMAADEIDWNFICQLKFMKMPTVDDIRASLIQIMPTDVGASSAPSSSTSSSSIFSLTSAFAASALSATSTAPSAPPSSSSSSSSSSIVSSFFQFFSSSKTDSSSNSTAVSNSTNINEDEEEAEDDESDLSEEEEIRAASAAQRKSQEKMKQKKRQQQEQKKKNRQQREQDRKHRFRQSPSASHDNQIESSSINIPISQLSSSSSSTPETLNVLESKMPVPELNDGKQEARRNDRSHPHRDRGNDDEADEEEEEEAEEATMEVSAEQEHPELNDNYTDLHASASSDGSADGAAIAAAVVQLRQDKFARLLAKLPSILKALSTIATSLHKNKEIRTLFFALMDDVVLPYLLKIDLRPAEVKLFGNKLIEACKSVAFNAKRVEEFSLWERFLRVVVPILIVMHTRVSASDP